MYKRFTYPETSLTTSAPFQARTVAVRPLPFYTIINLFQSVKLSFQPSVMLIQPNGIVHYMM
jgi:hypothetical protein